MSEQLNIFKADFAAMGAVLSECRRYRYALWRTWDTSKEKVVFFMLNPSTADARSDDRTVTRCINFAKSWGFGGLIICNLYAYRSTEPLNILTVDDPIGPDNLKYIKQAFESASMLITAWGNGKLVDKIDKRQGNSYKPLSGWGGPLHYLELAKDGTPKHPLYLNKEIKPVQFGVQRKTKIIN